MIFGTNIATISPDSPAYTIISSAALRRNTIVSALVIGIIVAFLGSSFCFSTLYHYSYVEASYAFCWIGIVIMLWTMITTLMMTKSLFTTYALWMVLFFLFCYGQQFLYLLGLLPDAENVYSKFTMPSIYHAQVFTCLSFIAFHFGALFYLKDCRTIQKYDQRYVESPTLSKAVKAIGLLFLIISIVPTLITIKQLFIISLAMGYRGWFGGTDAATGINNLIPTLSQLFIPAIIMLLYGYRQHKIAYFSILSVGFIYAAAYLLMGDRSTPLPLIVALVWINHQIMRLNKRFYYIYLILGIGFITTFSAFTATRNISNRDFSTFIELYKSSMSNNLLVASVAEFGSSMSPLIMIMDIVPSQYPLRMGETYIYSVTTLFPNLFWKIHPATLHCNIARWLVEEYGLYSGPGNSIPGEAYANFSWFGLFFIMLVGWLVARLLTYTEQDIIYNPLNIIFVALIICITLTSQRREMAESLRSVVYFAYIPLGIIRAMVSRFSVRESK